MPDKLRHFLEHLTPNQATEIESWFSEGDNFDLFMQELSKISNEEMIKHDEEAEERRYHQQRGRS